MNMSKRLQGFDSKDHGAKPFRLTIFDFFENKNDFHNFALLLGLIILQLFHPSIDMQTWEDRFRKERSEKNDLMQKVNELDHALRQSRKQSIQSNHEVQSNSTNKKIEREENDFIQVLRTRNDLLQQDQNKLHSRLKAASLTVKKLKQQIQTLKRRCSRGPPSRNKSIPKGKKNDGCRQCVEYDATCDSDAGHVLNQLQHRLMDANGEIQRLKEENSRLLGAAASRRDNHDTARRVLVPRVAKNIEVSNAMWMLIAYLRAVTI